MEEKFFDTKFNTTPALCATKIFEHSRFRGSRSNVVFFFSFLFPPRREKENNKVERREREWERKGDVKGYTAKSRILSLAACGLKQQPPSLSYREPNLPRPPLDERMSTDRKGVECTCGWPLVIFIGHVYRRAYRDEEKRREKKKQKKKKKKRNAEQARKKRGVEWVNPVIFFRPDFTEDEQISPRGVSAGYQ